MRRAKKQPSPLEAVTEAGLVRHVKADGGTSRKMNGMGFNSWPDRLLMNPRNPMPLWMELKRLGEEPTDAQHEVHKLLRRLGQTVVVCDNLQDAIEEYERHGQRGNQQRR